MNTDTALKRFIKLELLKQKCKQRHYYVRVYVDIED